MHHIIRAVRAAEWHQVKELRLTALADPLAPLAFLTTHAQAAAYPDERWQEMARRSEEGISTVTFVAEAPDGTWDGSVTVLVERPGEEGVLGTEIGVPQSHLVGVYVRPGQRGTGLAAELFRAAVDWSWALADPRLERVRLFVDERNERAEGLYRKLGFQRTGETLPVGDAAQCHRDYELALARPAVPTRPAR
ncbi:GNAT family N-acetyltransferase [Streptomyces sp. NPDC052396]|uniref:GNAT family N-acetyltransferase n=1 Tax=Streptomyces sp. NPDC052396 TaxID=3365689 RepID=UPI0037D0B2A5